MDLIDILELKNKGMISLVGGGGKTTTMFKLGEELKKEGYRVLLTTTTAIGEPKTKEYDYYFIGEIAKDFIPTEASITLYADEKNKNKLYGGDTKYLDKLLEDNKFDFIVVEADGAKMLPIKAPNKTEPVIPSKNTHTIGIIGIDSLGKKIGEIVHRPELFLKIISEDNLEIKLETKHIVKLILDEEGIFKNSKGEKIIFINKCDEKEKIEEGKEIRDVLKNKGYDNKVFISNVLTGKYY